MVELVRFLVSFFAGLRTPGTPFYTNPEIYCGFLRLFVQTWLVLLVYYHIDRLVAGR